VRQDALVGVVELYAQGAALVVAEHRLVQPTVLDAQFIEHPQGLTSEPAQFRVVALALQFGDHHEGYDHFVIGEPAESRRVGQQDRGVQHKNTARRGRFATPLMPVS